jgi:hypothetical protein
MQRWALAPPLGRARPTPTSDGWLGRVHSPDRWSRGRTPRRCAAQQGLADRRALSAPAAEAPAVRRHSKHWRSAHAKVIMPRTIHCWRCQMSIPMLTDDEWAQVEPHLANAIEQIKAYREQHNCSLSEATTKGFGINALAVYEALAGFRESNPNALSHHRLRLYGPDCPNCGKSLRTPQARFCAKCSYERPQRDGVDGGDA